MRVTTDPLEVSLHDSELHEEAELTTRLIIAVNESASGLSQREIDVILGVLA